MVGDGLGDAAYLEDDEFAGEAAFEGVDAAAELGDGHGDCLVIVVRQRRKDGRAPYQVRGDVIRGIAGMGVRWLV